jgi:hypothetical protein
MAVEPCRDDVALSLPVTRLTGNTLSLTNS